MNQDHHLEITFFIYDYLCVVLKSVWLSEIIKCEKYAKINQESCMCANYVKALESFPENDKTSNCGTGNTSSIL